MTRTIQSLASSLNLIRHVAIAISLAGGLTCPLPSAALGLGEIHPNSALSQPFDAEIELVSATAEELSSLKVGLAGADIYQRFGLERPAFLSSLVFRVVPTGDGRAVVRVTSTRPITEPVMTLLVEANWAGGRTVHEYTVFLDPPVFMPVQPAPQVVQNTQPMTPPPTEQARSSGVIERAPEPIVPPPTAEAAPTALPQAPAVSPVTEPVPEPAPTPPETAVAPPAPEQLAESAQQPGVAPIVSAPDYQVQRNDTLWKIASRIRPGTPQMVNQTMIALFRANPTAFVGGNINRLRAGVVLRIPSDEELLSVDVREANAEVARQYAEWRAQFPEQLTDSGRLRLVTPTEPVQTPTAQQTEAERAAREAEAQAAKAAAEAQAKADAEARAKAEAEAEAKRLLELRNAELARMQREREERAAAEAARQAEEQATAATEPAPPTQTQPDSEPAPVPPAETQAAPPAAAPIQPPSPESTLTDTLAGLPWTYILLGLGALLLGGGWIVYSRRRQSSLMHFPMPDSSAGVPTMTPSDFEAALNRDAQHATTSVLDQSQFEDPRTLQVETLSEDRGTLSESVTATRTRETGDLSRPARSADDTLSSETAVHMEGQDALAEADFHMAYGLYDQAADLIKIAIQREPNRRDLKFKLLEIFFVWGNKDSFIEVARELYQSRDVAPAGEWDRILVMGKQIAPENPMFKGGAQHVGDMIDVNLEGGENRVDIDLFAAPEGPDQGGAGLDFELASTGVRPKANNIDFLLEETSNRKVGLDETREMVDPTARTQETPTIESPSLDITAEHPRVTLRTEQTIRERTVALDFDKDQNVVPAASEQTAELSIDDLGLDVGDRGLEATGALDQGADQIGDDELTRIAPAPSPKARPSSLEPTMEVPVMKEPAPKRGNGHADVDEDESVSTFYLEQITGEGGELIDTMGPRTGDTAMLAPEDLDVDLAKLGEESREDTMRRKMRVQAEAPTVEMPTPRAVADVAPTVEHPRPQIDRADLVATTELPEVEPVTMSEVGTKLDLARAYIDMGDPDGARSILEEVLGEGNSGQRAEAQRLLDSIR